MKFKCNTGLKSGVNNKEKGVDVVLDVKGKGEEKMTADVVLLSIGRRPFTGGLGPDKAGLETTDRGQVEINKNW
jgi:dihydrolipoamide dehydrogenase